MFKNYAKTAIRNLLRYKVYSTINVLGLAIGMACSILIFLYVHHELSYDRQHEHYERLYRLSNELRISGKLDNAALTPFPLAPALQRDFPEVELAGRFMSYGTMISFEYENRLFMEESVYFADSTIPQMFSYHFVHGSRHTALREPNTAIISLEMARRHFGDTDPIGKVLLCNRRTPVRVDAVVRGPGEHTHMPWNALVSMATLDTIVSPQFKEGWLAVSCNTYVLLHEGRDGASLEARLPELFDNYIKTLAEKFNSHVRFAITPLAEVYLNSPDDLIWMPGPTGSTSTVLIFLAIAVFILLIASINYMNLATARSAGRSREVGIRKVLGAMRGQLMKQFLLESVFLAFIALVLALVLAELLLPVFNELSGHTYHIDYTGQPLVLAGLAALALLVGILAGSYPAFYLSAFRPLHVLKGKLAAVGGSVGLRKVLVVVQFAISIAMIIGTWIVFRQLHYVQQKDLGFQPEQVVAIPMPSDTAVINKIPIIKTSLEQHKDVTVVASASTVPGGSVIKQLFKVERDSVMEENVLQLFFVDHSFLDAMQIDLLEGRNFDSERPSDVQQSFIINKTMAEKFGWREAIGKRIQWGFSPDGSALRDGTVIGVVDDFHVSSLHKPVEPLVLMLSPSTNSFLFVRISAANVALTMDYISETWRSFDVRQPLEYYFMDEYFNRQYAADEQRAAIFLYFALLTIFIACLGLFGLASFTAEQRRKEIGIRKVIGASVPNIIGLLSRDFLVLVALAAIPAWALTYFAMQWWLQDFAYRVSIEADAFIYSGLIALSISLLTISYQSLRAALSNPINSLKYE